MNKKPLLSIAAAAAVLASGTTGSYKLGESSGRDSVLAPMRSTPLSGQQVMMKTDAAKTGIFAVVSPDCPAATLQKLAAMCPTNQFVVIAGQAKAPPHIK